MSGNKSGDLSGAEGYDSGFPYEYQSSGSSSDEEEEEVEVEVGAVTVIELPT